MLNITHSLRRILFTGAFSCLLVGCGGGGGGTMRAINSLSAGFQSLDSNSILPGEFSTKPQSWFTTLSGGTLSLVAVAQTPSGVTWTLSFVISNYQATGNYPLTVNTYVDLTQVNQNGTTSEWRSGPGSSLNVEGNGSTGYTVTANSSQLTLGSYGSSGTGAGVVSTRVLRLTIGSPDT